MCQARPEFHDERAVDRLARRDPGRSPASAERSRNLRQGIRRRGFNCKSDDRFAEPACLRHALLQRRGIDALRALQQGIRAAETRASV